MFEFPTARLPCALSPLPGGFSKRLTCTAALSAAAAAVATLPPAPPSRFCPAVPLLTPTVLAGTKVDCAGVGVVQPALTRRAWSLRLAGGKLRGVLEPRSSHSSGIDNWMQNAAIWRIWHGKRRTNKTPRMHQATTTARAAAGQRIADARSCQFLNSAAQDNMHHGSLRA